MCNCVRGKASAQALCAFARSCFMLCDHRIRLDTMKEEQKDVRIRLRRIISRKVFVKASLQLQNSSDQHIESLSTALVALSMIKAR